MRIEKQREVQDACLGQKDIVNFVDIALVGQLVVPVGYVVLVVDGLLQDDILPVHEEYLVL